MGVWASIKRVFDIARDQFGQHESRIIARYPGESFHSQRDAIAALVEELQRLGDWYGSVVGSLGDEQRLIQLTEDTVNFCAEPIDLAHFTSMLNKHGLARLAPRVVESGKGLFTIPEATPDELAAITDVYFSQHYRMGDQYHICASIGDA